MKRNVKVAIWGFGAMGSGMAKMLLTKKGIEIVGVCDMAPHRVGKSLYEVLGTEKGNRTEVIIRPEIEEVLAEKPDVCLVATDTFTKKVFPKIKLVLEKKINVIYELGFFIHSIVLEWVDVILPGSARFLLQGSQRAPGNRVARIQLHYLEQAGDPFSVGWHSPRQPQPGFDAALVLFNGYPQGALALDAVSSLQQLLSIIDPMAHSRHPRPVVVFSFSFNSTKKLVFR